MKRKLQSPAHIKFFVAICWLAYFTTYLGRLDYSASMNEIIRSGFLSKLQAGAIGTGFFFCYGFGQLASGFLGERISSRWMVFAGISGSAVVNLLMALAKSADSMLPLWCVNGFAQSLIWASMVKILSDRLTGEKCKKACIFLSTTAAAGTMSAYLLAAAVICLSDWRKVFLASSVCVGLISIVWLAAISEVEKTADEDGIVEETAGNPFIGKPRRISLPRLFWTRGLIPISVCILIQGVLKDGVTAWVPTYIHEMFGLGSAVSILASTLLPVFNIAGVYAANCINTRFCKNEVKTSAVCFAVTLVALVLLVPAGSWNAIFAAFLLALATTGMVGVNTMLISLVPLYFAGIGKVSTITGIMNFMAYAGSALSMYGIGAVSQKFGWNMTINIWFALAVTGCLICIAAKRVWEAGKKPRKRPERKKLLFNYRA